MINTLTFYLPILAALTLSSLAFGQTHLETNKNNALSQIEQAKSLNKIQIGVVDIDYITSNSKAFNELREYIQIAEENISQKKQTEQNEMLLKQDILKKKKKQMKKRTFDANQKALMTTSLKIQKNFEDKNVFLRKLRKKVEDHIYHKINQEIEKHAYKRGIFLVLKTSSLYQSTVLFFSKKIDISALILEKLNKEIPSVQEIIENYATSSS